MLIIEVNICQKLCKIFFLLCDIRNTVAVYFTFSSIAYNAEDVVADDPQVLSVIKEKYLVSPSKLPYNLSEPEEINPSMGQGQRIDYILKGKVRKCVMFVVQCYSKAPFLFPLNLFSHPFLHSPLCFVYSLIFSSISHSPLLFP